MRLSPVLAELDAYPFQRIEEAKLRVAARGVTIYDFGIGDPREPTDPLIRRALADAIGERSSYPLARGLPELREAIAAWAGRRFGVSLDPESSIIPTLGSKEAIFSLAQAVLDLRGGRDLVVTTEPGYPVGARGALFAGGSVLELPLLEERGYLPALDAVPPGTWSRVAIVWLNYPNNPTGATAPLAYLERAAALAREHDFLLACDEAYSELYYGDPPVSALQLSDLRNVAVFNTLSKRSSMTGYRSGFVAGDPQLIAALRKFRPSVGTAPQEFVQRASVVAWGDEAHVERVREVYRNRRELFLALFARKGLRVAGGDAGLYLWVAAPTGETSEQIAERLLLRGVVVAPGSYLGPSGEGFFRLALVPAADECLRAIDILEEEL